jgi:peptidoglycan/xylan/chitin deacetylase (PgdA/CDA1 family)
MKRSSRPPFFFRFFSPQHLVCRMPGQEKKVFLTFDDGPVPEVTPEVLKILADHGAKASFFMVGDNVKKHPEVYEQVVSGGHAAGNHTFHHLNGWKTAPAAYAEDVKRCDALFRTRLFRPPYGRFTPSQYMILRKDYLFVMWSVLTWDFSHKITPEECLENACRDTRPGDIVVFHDSLKASKNMLYTLPRFLEHFSKQGFSFEKILG